MVFMDNCDQIVIKLIYLMFILNINFLTECINF